MNIIETIGGRPFNPASRDDRELENAVIGMLAGAEWRHAAEVAGAHGLPVVAIGGITPENSGRVFESGADYAAIISALITPNPGKTLKALVKTKHGSGSDESDPYKK